MDHTITVTHKDVFWLHAGQDQQLGTGDGGSTGTQYTHFGVFNFLTNNFQRVQCTGYGYNRSTVLVIVEYRNVALFDQSAFDFKTLRCLDVFQVDTTESDRDTTNSINEGLRAFRLNFDVDGVYAGKAFEQQALTFHNRLRSQRAQVTQTQNGSTVSDNSNQVTLTSVLVGVFRISSDLFYWLCHTWAVGQRQIV